MVSSYMCEYLWYEMTFFSLKCALYYVKYLLKKMSLKDVLDIYINEFGLYEVTTMI